jgi:hypothetical protein
MHTAPRDAATLRMQKPGAMAGLVSSGIPSTSISRWAKMDAPERLSPFEPFSARSQHLGWLDLMLVEGCGRQALEDVDKDIESAL